MKKYGLIICLALFLFNALLANAQVGIGTTTPDASSLLDLESTSKGIIVPRMTQAQESAISSPATGLLVYQTDGAAGFWYYNGATWVSLIGGCCTPSSGTPGYTAGAGAGTSPTITITGDNIAGKITILTGTAPTASSNIVTINFNTALTIAPYVVISPGNAKAAALNSGNAPYISSTSTGGFVMAIGSGTLSGANTYIWYYEVAQ